MIFPFAGGSYDGNLPIAFLLQKQDSFGLVVRLLVGYPVDDRIYSLAAPSQQTTNFASSNIRKGRGWVGYSPLASIIASGV